ISGLPDTPPLYEIHVNSPRMEGCHLRAGTIARGGIRFSDRPDDYRTEILDLMKTQTVKNAIIVPTGAKGGFIVKSRRGASADANEGVTAYRTLINAMLDLTDNLTPSGITHPPLVKVMDTDGPYLVVAADKGTATFSDLANKIAIEREFWLGDAFASGGEHGYDHKRLGITARGAWESARRHLREMERDPDRGAPVTMVGIGDMSGDVFGNGLLQSRNLKLIAAFDHRNIFIDPDPDLATSFAERKRLFEMPRSSWADYDRKILSAGGGVFRRGQKRIELSKQARTALGIDADAMDGESLIAAILRAPVDLLYNGGIGTYVRASKESDAEVGDHANDACRITANELRAKVVVEGGNLGLTQNARIEYALAGGRINTDAIDNSAGVDMSDHEVNLKILLEPALTRNAMSIDERNAILAACGDEIAAQVIADNHDQALSLSLEQIRSRSRLSIFRDHAQAIEARGLTHQGEALLPSREALHERHARYPGLTRPELAIVTAYTKIDLAKRLANSPLAGDPYLAARFLKPYFPSDLSKRFSSDVEQHRLRRELIATGAVNELVDLAGSTFIERLVRDHGADGDSALRAWIVGSGVLAANDCAQELKSATRGVSANAEFGSFLALERACRGAASWALARIDQIAPITTIVAQYRLGLEKLYSEFEPMLAADERDRFERIYRDLRRDIGDGELAHRLARITFAEHLLEVLNVSFANQIEPKRVAEIYFRLSDAIGFAWLQDALEAADSDDRWERRATVEMGAELRAVRIRLCRTTLEIGLPSTAEAIEQLKSRHEREFAEINRLFSDLKTLSAPNLPALQVAIRAVSKLAGTG
ncbi:MAG TPA: NAD-glutamate dehydrogenase domain-containing protein, partial [Candidatus Binataceae bacterium]|nr:NAD-glutamate dehydrogenase domain-containing protein [Candidatus Binataceae bacterium]